MTAGAERFRVCLEARLFRALITRPDRATYEYVASVMWGDDAGRWPADWSGIIKVKLCIMRPALRVRGIRVVSRYGLGFEMVAPPTVNLEAVFREFRNCAPAEPGGATRWRRQGCPRPPAFRDHSNVPALISGP